MLFRSAPTRTLNLVSCGDRSAIAAWGPWAAQGRWVWWLKDRIDRGFVARYVAAADFRHTVDPTPKADP